MNAQSPLDFEPLDVDRIETAREKARLGRKIVLFKSTASTNDIAWRYAANPSHDGLCVLAESQSKGRGRRGRSWYSQPGQSILASILLTDVSIPAELLTLTAAVAAAEAIRIQCDLPCRIKWPNDVLINGKKVAGVLVESKMIRKQPHFVIGIGMNCHQSPAFFEGYNLPATSLSAETGNSIDRTELVCGLLAALEQWLDKARDSRTVTARWQQQSDLLGRHIVIESDNRCFSGFCRGIDPAEGLIIHLDSGAVRIFSASQTSILEVGS